MSALRGWMLVALAGAICAAALLWQQSRVALLREELAQKRDELGRVAALERENERLKKALAEQPRVDDAVLQQARAEAARLRQRDAKSAPVAAARARTRSDPYAEDWKNVGRTTPEYSLETTLWAATGGDIDTFAAGLVFFDASVKASAQRLLERSPSAVAQYGTPERFIAALTIPNVPPGGVEVNSWTDVKDTPLGPACGVGLKVTHADGRVKPVMLTMLKSGDGWRVVVTKRVIDGFAEQLAGSPKP